MQEINLIFRDWEAHTIVILGINLATRMRDMVKHYISSGLDMITAPKIESGHFITRRFHFQLLIHMKLGG
jgi:hypothetical protein